MAIIVLLGLIALPSVLWMYALADVMRNDFQYFVVETISEYPSKDFRSIKNRIFERLTRRKSLFNINELNEETGWLVGNDRARIFNSH
jgi:hypothetical protein